MTGTITKRESRTVVQNMLDAEKISAATYSWRGKSLHMLVGNPEVIINVPAKLGYYDLKAIEHLIPLIAQEIRDNRARRQQVDIETLIAETPA